VTSKTTQKLQAFVNRCLRNILGIWWPQIISNEEQWERTGQLEIDVEIKLKRRKYGWIRQPWATCGPCKAKKCQYFIEK
jgi:hypothetical protein